MGKGNAAGKDTIPNSKRILIREYFEKDDAQIERIYKERKGKRQIEIENINYVKKGTKITRNYSDVGTTRTDSVMTTDTGTIHYSFGYNEQIAYKKTHFNQRERVTAIFFTERPNDNETFQYELDKMGNWIECKSSFSFLFLVAVRYVIIWCYVSGCKSVALPHAYFRC